MRLHMVYRSTGSENRKGRPPFYSKLSSLQSMLRSFQACPEAGELVFHNDGPVPDDRLELMRASGTVVEYEGLGQQDAFRAAVRRPQEHGWPDGDLVYVAEDDYLYRPEAFASIADAARRLPDVHYLALYGTIGDRMPNGEPLHPGLRAPRVGSEVLVEGWRRGLSHTASFAVRVAALRRDLRLHDVAQRCGSAWDHHGSLTYQGLLPYTPAEFSQALLVKRPWERRAKLTAWRLALTGMAVARRRDPHVLALADPPLATHVEHGVIAAGTDWEALARG